MATDKNGMLTVVESRRSFLSRCATTLAGVSVVGFIAPLLQGCEPSSTIAGNGNNGNGGGTTNPPINTGGGGTTFSIAKLDADGKGLVTTTKGSDGAPILIVRNSATVYQAMSMRCTHQGCTVEPPSSAGQIICACHGSRFDLNGGVITGPASAPLKQYETTFNEATKTVTVKIV